MSQQREAEEATKLSKAADVEAREQPGGRERRPKQGAEGTRATEKTVLANTWDKGLGQLALLCSLRQRV